MLYHLLSKVIEPLLPAATLPFSQVPNPKAVEFKQNQEF
jgi:hypothetical protein